MNLTILGFEELMHIAFDAIILLHNRASSQLIQELSKLSDSLDKLKLAYCILEKSQIEPAFGKLKNSDSVVIFISDQADSPMHQFSAFEPNFSNSWLIVHPSISTAEPYKSGLLNQIPDGLRVKFIGHQTHITPSASLEEVQSKNIEILRLGQVRQNMDKVEPWCRSVDHVIFHTESIRKTDFPAKHSTNPGGFTYEEACKLCQFIGASSHLKSIGFYVHEFSSIADDTSAGTVAQMIWYLLDGYFNFKEEKPKDQSKLTQYIVHASLRDTDIHFWKSNDTGRWWMEIPGHEHYWIPCTYEDYIEASNGEFSAKLLQAINQF